MSSRSSTFTPGRFLRGRQGRGRALLVCSLLVLGMAFADETLGQPVHGEITTVDGNQLRIELADSFTVEDSTEGRVVEERTVGERTVQMSFALVMVETVDRPASGPWIAHCRIQRRTENIEVGDQVRFKTVQRRSQLVLRSDPGGATVYAQGESLGTTPLDRPLQPGTYEFRLEREGFSTETRTVSVAPGKQRVVDVPLKRTEGRLVVNSLPEGALVERGHSRIGHTPLDTTVQTGTDTLTIQREGYLPAVRVLEVQRGQETRVNVSLRRPIRIQLAEKQGDAVSNVRLRREKEKLAVRYDLVGGSEQYNVDLLLSTNGGKTFEPLPKTVTGAAGEEIQPGSGKTIVWAVLEDFPKGFPGEGNRLRVATDAQGGRGVFWIIGSAVVAGGGATVAALLLGGDESGEGSLPESPPAPPQ